LNSRKMCLKICFRSPKAHTYESKIFSVKHGVRLCHLWYKGIASETGTCDTSTTHPSHSANADFYRPEKCGLSRDRIGFLPFTVCSKALAPGSPSCPKAPNSRYTGVTKCHTGSKKSKDKIIVGILVIHSYTGNTIPPFA
jgi:hypothetical protein